MASFHHGTLQQSALPPATTARQYTGAGSDPEWFALGPTVLANKAVSPVGALEIGGASRVVGERLLKIQ
jgi:hypothetical protein